jgi:TPR repeat protein
MGFGRLFRRNPTRPEGIDALLASKPSEEIGQALMQWVEETKNRIARGDMAIGILSIPEVQKVPEALSKAIDCGVQQAALDLAWWYAWPPFGESDPKRGDEILARAIQNGLMDARLRLVQLRWFFRRDESTESERAEAFHLCRVLAQQPDPSGEAAYFLGLLTCAGFGAPADATAAFESQRRAADLGNSDAMFELYVHHSQGIGVTQDHQAAFEANERAAEAGHPRALYNMGAFYATGHLVEKDMKTAADWYEKAADKGNPQALAMLAVMYAKGEGVEQDTEYATDLFNQADYLGFDVQGLKESVGI